MSDVEGAGGDEYRDKKKKKSKDKDKDKKKHRTPEEKEARRARKAAKEAAASADVQGIISDANLDDASDDGMGTPGRVTEAATGYIAQSGDLTLFGQPVLDSAQRTNIRLLSIGAQERSTQ